jgi:DNA-binding MarR family transcriptional regulator
MSHQDKVVAPLSPRGADGVPDDDMMVEVKLRLRLDEIADFEAGLLRVSSARREPAQKELRRLARKIYDARRARDRLLDNRLFGEPAWDMLLALYFLPASGLMLTVSGLACCSGVPHTTALRWQTRLLEEGLIERGPHETDRRMQMLRLTDAARDMLEGYLARLLRCEGQIFNSEPN